MLLNQSQNRILAALRPASDIAYWRASLPFTAEGRLVVCSAASLSIADFVNGTRRCPNGRVAIAAPGSPISDYREGLPFAADGGLIVDPYAASVGFTNGVPVSPTGIAFLAQDSGLCCPYATASFSALLSRTDVARVDGSEISALYALESATFNANDAETGTSAVTGPSWDRANGSLLFTNNTPAGGRALGVNSTNWSAFAGWSAAPFFYACRFMPLTATPTGTFRVVWRTPSHYCFYQRNYSGGLDRFGTKGSGTERYENSALDRENVWIDVIWAVHSTSSVSIWLDGTEYAVSGANCASTVTQWTQNGASTIDQNTKAFALGNVDITTPAQVAAIRGWLDAH